MRSGRKEPQAEPDKRPAREFPSHIKGLPSPSAHKQHATTGVTTLAVNDIKPSDILQMHGFTPADTSAGLAGAQRLTPTAEFVTFSHAANGGSPARSVGVLLTGHGASAFPTAAQFRAARRLRAQTTRRSIARAEKERGRALLVEIGHLAGGVASGLGPWADAL